MSITREEALRDIAKWKKAIEEEDSLRFDVMQTKDYKAVEEDAAQLQHTIGELGNELAATTQRKLEMLQEVPDSREQLQVTKLNLIDLMNLEGVEGYTEDWISVSGKFSEKRTVNAHKLLETLGGDITEFCKIAIPSQKAVKDYAQEVGNKAILTCIRLESRELTDIEITLLIERPIGRPPIQFPET